LTHNITLERYLPKQNISRQKSFIAYSYEHSKLKFAEKAVVGNITTKCTNEAMQVNPKLGWRVKA